MNNRNNRKTKDLCALFINILLILLEKSKQTFWVYFLELGIYNTISRRNLKLKYWSVQASIDLMRYQHGIDIDILDRSTHWIQAQILWQAGGSSLHVGLSFGHTWSVCCRKTPIISWLQFMSHYSKLPYVLIHMDPRPDCGRWKMCLCHVVLIPPVITYYNWNTF